jgi:2-methylcitrate dehydratase
MDSVVRRLVGHALDPRWDALPPSVRHECKRRIVDTLGCAIAAFDAEPSRIARALAMRVHVDQGARILGTQHRTLPELATFANGVMARYLDGNDAFPGGGGHPSDVIAPVLALCDATGASGDAALSAIALGYDLHYALFHGLNIFERGLDHPLYTAMATSIVASRLLQLNPEQIAHALSLAVTANLALGATRRGSLSLWKGCASGNAARNGLFAALLAQAGMTGPDRPIEGALGLESLLGGSQFGNLIGPDQPFRVLQADMKFYVTEFHSEAAIMLALQLREGVDLAEIAAVEIDTYPFAYAEIGSGPEKWRPTTRETADHSMPYIVAAVLVDQAFSDAIFDQARLADPAVLRVADKVIIRNDPDLSRNLSGPFPCRMTIVLTDGSVRSASMPYPRGYHDDPMSDDEVAGKFRGLARRKLARDQVEQALDHIWTFDAHASAGDIFERMRMA